jgi:predicted DNA-binding transcriptional regulator AlpA
MQKPPSYTDDPLLGTNEIAAILGKHPLSIYRYLRENPEFPVPMRLTANRLAWRKSAIDAFINSRPLRTYRKVGGAKSKMQGAK